jgi:ABC-type transport system substrate-binding protein
MERGVYLKKMQGGLKEWPGVQIMFAATRIGGTWSNWYDTRFKCGGFNAKDFFCVKDLDDQFAKYLASSDRAERKQLAEQIQRTILEEYYFVPVFRHAFVNAVGPRVAANGRMCSRPSPPATAIQQSPTRGAEGTFWRTGVSRSTWLQPPAAVIRCQSENGRST